MRNYYIIGSKRRVEDDSYQDVWEYMLKAKAVDVGYAWSKNLSSLFGKAEDVVFDTLKRRGESNHSSRAHKLFLNLRPGDIVAIKKYASPKGKIPRLAIHGYAVVCARNGTIYRHTKGRLPHQISVDFLQTDNPQMFHIGGYGETIHRLSNPNHIRQVFGPILGKHPSADRSELKNLKTERRRDVTLKNVEDFAYRINKKVTVSAKHNRLQNCLYQQLVKQYGVKNVLMEKNYVDVEVRIGNQVTLYEVKPFDSALFCLRDALGQIETSAKRF